MTTADDIELRRRVYVLRQYLPEHSRSADISPDYAHIQVPLTWGGIWQAPGLDLKLRSLATISAQCVNGWDFGLQHQIRAGLTMGMSPQKIKGIFIQLLFYAGIPATVFGLRVAQEVINEREEWKAQDLPLETQWLASLEEKLQRGRDLRVRHWGAEANAEVEGSLARRMVPEAAELVDAYHFGEVWAREDLSARERMVCILVALMCRGHMKQLGQHIGYALTMGFTQREICEVISQAGWYRGWPYVEEALEQARAAFEAKRD